MNSYEKMNKVEKVGYHLRHMQRAYRAYQLYNSQLGENQYAQTEVDEAKREILEESRHITRLMEVHT